MRMLDKLKKQLPEIEIQDVYAFNFISAIIIQKEVYPEIKISGKQFNYLIQLQNRFCHSEAVSYG